MKKIIVVLCFIVMTACDEKQQVEMYQDVPESIDVTRVYVLNTNSMKFHFEECFSAEKLLDANREVVVLNREDIIELGYFACGNCNP